MISAIDTETVELIGLNGIVELWGQTRPTVYSKARRGKFGQPDWTVAVPREDGKGVPVWLRQRFGAADEVDTSPPAGELPPLLAMEEIALALGVQRRTVETMRGRGRQDIKAPEPYTHIGRTPVWWAPPWQEFARLTGRPFDLALLQELTRERQLQQA